MLALYLSALGGDADRAFFVRIYERCEDKLYAVALNILKQPRAAEDAVQDSLVKVLNHFDAAKKIFADERSNFDAWIVTIVKRTALDMLRKEKRAEPLAEDWDAPDGGDVEAESGYDALVALVRAMPEGYRAVLELRLVCEWGFSEIGKSLGITAGAARARYDRGLKLLREKCREEGYGDDGEGV